MMDCLHRVCNTAEDQGVRVLRLLALCETAISGGWQHILYTAVCIHVNIGGAEPWAVQLQRSALAGSTRSSQQIPCPTPAAPHERGQAEEDDEEVELEIFTGNTFLELREVREKGKRKGKAAVVACQTASSHAESKSRWWHGPAMWRKTRRIVRTNPARLACCTGSMAHSSRF